MQQHLGYLTLLLPSLSHLQYTTTPNWSKPISSTYCWSYFILRNILIMHLKTCQCKSTYSVTSIKFTYIIALGDAWFTTCTNSDIDVKYIYASSHKTKLETSCLICDRFANLCFTHDYSLMLYKCYATLLMPSPNQEKLLVCKDFYTQIKYTWILNLWSWPKLRLKLTAN